MSLKGKLYHKVIKYIKDSDIQVFVEKVLDRVDSKFWKAPSSSSGKFHPPEDNNEGGLVRHVLKATYTAYELARFYNISEHIISYAYIFMRNFKSFSLMS